MWIPEKRACCSLEYQGILRYIFNELPKCTSLGDALGSHENVRFQNYPWFISQSNKIDGHVYIFIGHLYTIFPTVCFYIMDRSSCTSVPLLWMHPGGNKTSFIWSGIQVGVSFCNWYLRCVAKMTMRHFSTANEYYVRMIRPFGGCLEHTSWLQVFK